jgi:hypothetical protein
MSQSASSRLAGYRFPPEIISHAVCFYFRSSLSLRMIEEMLAACGIIVSHETVRPRSQRSSSLRISAKSGIPVCGRPMVNHQKMSLSLWSRTCAAVRFAGGILRVDAAGPFLLPRTPWHATQFSE